MSDEVFIVLVSIGIFVALAAAGIYTFISYYNGTL